MNGAVQDLITWSCSKNNLCILEGSGGDFARECLRFARFFHMVFSIAFLRNTGQPAAFSEHEGRPPLAFFLDGSPSENLTYAFYDLVQHSLCLMDKSVGILESVCDVKATDPRNISLVIDHGLESLVDVR